MTVSYAGVALGYQTPELIDFIESKISPEDIFSFAERSNPGARLDFLPFRQGLTFPPVRIGKLWWPTGASRFAVASYLVDQSQIDAIRLVTYSTGATNGYQVAPLVLGDSTSSVTTDMWMLPPRPLAGVTDLPLYLLTLVDERFFWWFKTSTLTVTGGTTTWATLFADLASALGITLTVDIIDAAYLKPDPKFTLRDEPLPLLLDAAAFCCGQRFVRQLDGTCRTWLATNSRDQTATNLALVPTAGNYDVSAGGVFAIGTVLPLVDDVAALPASVEVIYPVQRCGVDSGTISYNVTLASLALADFAGVSGSSGNTKTFHASAVAGQQPTVSPPYNDAELQTLTEAIARDFYRHQVGRLDLRLVGYPAWTITGLDDHLEYQHDMDCGLRVVRGPWLDHLEELLYYSTYGSAPAVVVPPVVKFVRITSLVQVGGYYPAEVVTFDIASQTWIAGEAVWWRDANQ